MLDIIAASATASSTIAWHEKWKSFEEIYRVQQQIDDLHTQGSRRPTVQSSRSNHAKPWFYQVHLLQCAFSAYWRNPIHLFAKLVFNASAGLFIGFTYRKAKDTPQGTQNVLFALFLGMIVCTTLANQPQVLFIEARCVYEVRDRPTQMYSWRTLVTAQLLVELPWNVFGAALFFC